MTDRAIVIGDTPEAVVATAEARQIAINQADIMEFSSLATLYSPDFPRSGKVEAGRKGYVVIGEAQ